MARWEPMKSRISWKKNWKRPYRIFSSNTCLIIWSNLSMIKISPRSDLPFLRSENREKEGGGTLKSYEPLLRVDHYPLFFISVSQIHLDNSERLCSHSEFCALSDGELIETAYFFLSFVRDRYRVSLICLFWANKSVQAISMKEASTNETF